MRFIKPGEWITPRKNRDESPLSDVSPLYAGIGAGISTTVQIASYPIAVLVTGIGHILTRGK